MGRRHGDHARVCQRSPIGIEPLGGKEYAHARVTGRGVVRVREIALDDGVQSQVLFLLDERMWEIFAERLSWTFSKIPGAFSADRA